MKKDLAELARLVRGEGSRGFTPSVRDVPDLLSLLESAEDDDAEAIERAIARVGEPAIDAIATRLAEARAAAADAGPSRAESPKARARLIRAVGRFVDSPRARALLLDELSESDAKARRNAIIALGKARAEASVEEAAHIEDALLAAWAKETRPDHKRSLAASLGKIGGPRALEALRAADGDEAAKADPELARIVTRALLMLERTESRGAQSAIDTEHEAATPLPIVLHCRAGVEAILAAELGPDFEPRVARHGLVHATLRGAIKRLFNARTWFRFGFALPQQWVRDGEDAGDAVVRAITSPEARAIFETFTVGEKRYRVDWAKGGHRRAVVWRVAEWVKRIDPTIVNDPTASTWEAVVHERSRFVDVELVPRAIDDPRFAYRTGDVPAASHPTLAAALVRVAGVQKGDVVWDPFVGSGTELIERALAGPYARMIGTDREPKALETARANLNAANVERVDLELADATLFRPPTCTLILTNPPMGRRVERTGDLKRMLDVFIERVPQVLAPRGRLVWLSPFGERTRARAERGGLTVELAHQVDIGGFVAELQRLAKPA